MIYKNMAALLGDSFYEANDKERDSRGARVFGSVAFFMILLPAPLVSFLLWKHMEEIPQELIDIGLYEAENP